MCSQSRLKELLGDDLGRIIPVTIKTKGTQRTERHPVGDIREWAEVVPAGGVHLDDESPPKHYGGMEIIIPREVCVA